MTDYNLTVSVNHEGIPPLLDVVQGDSGRNIVITVADMDISDCIARVYVVKPGGLDVYNNAAVVGDVILVELTAQMLAEVGNAKMQVTVYNAVGERVSTFNIWLNVEESLQDNGRINSSTEYKTLDELIEGANTAIEDTTAATDEANKAADSANSAASSANTAAIDAGSAATAANSAAQSANTAATAANEAAAAITYPVPITGGGTGAIDYKGALANLRAAETTTEVLTYYVNATSGNDDNDGLTESTAFKTIQHAVDVLPKLLKHSTTILLAEGIYPEDVIIKGFGNSGGRIRLQGNVTTASLALAANYTINSIQIISCTAEINLSCLTFTNQNSAGVTVDKSINVGMSYIRAINTGTYGFNITARSIVSVVNCYVSDKNTAFRCYYGSKLHLGSPTGDNNSIGVYSIGGSYIALNGDSKNTGATTAYGFSGGGIIIGTNGTILTT